MRRFGRQCRGIGHVCVTLARRTAPHVLETGAHVLPLAPAAQAYLHGATPLSAAQRAPLTTRLTAALEAPHRSAHQSRRLTQGKPFSHGTIVHADDPSLAPMCQGKRHCPAQLGRKPGRIAEPTAGFLFALQLPVGNPSDTRSVPPVVDDVEQAITRVRTRPTPAIHALAGDLALNDAAWREAWQARGMLTGGLPTTSDPLAPAPPPEDGSRRLDEADVHGIRTPTQVHLACACGSRRPGVESIMASLPGRGAGSLTSKGHRGAIVQTGRALVAHNAATLGRLHDYRLSKRGRMFRRRRRFRCRKVNQDNASIN
jgi:hypothetical protein